MKKYKKGMATLTLILFILFSSEVNALENEVYYRNENNVVFTKEEYDFISLMYWEGYQSMMTMDDYTHFLESKAMDGKIKVKSVDYWDNDIVLFGSSSHSSASKTIKIVTSCSSNCLVSVTLTWQKNPTIRSYDVIGAYIEGTTFVGTPTTLVSAGGTSTTITDLKKTSNGIGSSFKLPTGSSVVINQVFRVNSGGTIYASYQHAAKNSTLTISKDYTFSKNGYGRVFSFSNSSKDYYDGMGGVSIDV